MEGAHTTAAVFAAVLAAVLPAIASPRWASSAACLHARPAVVVAAPAVGGDGETPVCTARCPARGKRTPRGRRRADRDFREFAGELVDRQELLPLGYQAGRRCAAPEPCHAALHQPCPNRFRVQPCARVTCSPRAVRHKPFSRVTHAIRGAVRPCHCLTATACPFPRWGGRTAVIAPVAGRIWFRVAFPAQMALITQPAFIGTPMDVAV